MEVKHYPCCPPARLLRPPVTARSLPPHVPLFFYTSPLQVSILGPSDLSLPCYTFLPRMLLGVLHMCHLLSVASGPSLWAPRGPGACLVHRGLCPTQSVRSVRRCPMGGPTSLYSLVAFMLCVFIPSQSTGVMLHNKQLSDVWSILSVSQRPLAQAFSAINYVNCTIARISIMFLVGISQIQIQI